MALATERVLELTKVHTFMLCNITRTFSAPGWRFTVTIRSGIWKLLLNITKGIAKTLVKVLQKLKSYLQKHFYLISFKYSWIFSLVNPNYFWITGRRFRDFKMPSEQPIHTGLSSTVFSSSNPIQVGGNVI